MIEPLPPVAVDFESGLIFPGNPCPEIACGSLAWEADGSERILSPEQMRAELGEQVRRSTMIIGANLPYDLALAAEHGIVTIEEAFAVFDRNRAWDVQIAQALDAIAHGDLEKDPRTGQPLRQDRGDGKTKKARYNLQICASLTLGRDDAKENDWWRPRYALLIGIPLDRWPAEARQYPKDDVRNTMDVALAQCGIRDRPMNAARPGPGPLANLGGMGHQARALWALSLASARGFRTDPARVADLEHRAQEAVDKFTARFTGRFIRAGGPKAGTEDQAAVKREIALAHGASGKCPRCGGSGRIERPGAISEKTGRQLKGSSVVCKAADFELVVDTPVYGCDGTGLDLSTAPGLPRTDKGGIKTDRDTLAETGDEDLLAYGDNEAGKILTTYVPWVKLGLGAPIHPRPNILLENGRASYDSLIQLLPKDSEWGVRECISARDGWAFASIDYEAIELCSLAQSCLDILGWSTMADAINATGKPGLLHTKLAARMTGRDADELAALVKAKDKAAMAARQAAKPANFGFPGGMGAPALVLSQRKKSAGTTVGPDGTEYAGNRFCILIGREERCGHTKVTEWKKRPIPPTCKRCLECADSIRDAWFAQWPEMRPYFSFTAARADEGSITQLRSDRVRGGVTFMSASNGYFSSLAADGAKHAFWLVSKECYTDRKSPMYGSRPLFFAHDEIVAEIPECVLHEASKRVAEVWVAGMREFLPGVTVAAEPAAMYHYSKDAKTVYSAGRLIADPATR